MENLASRSLLTILDCLESGEDASYIGSSVSVEPPNRQLKSLRRR